MKNYVAISIALIYLSSSIANANEFSFDGGHLKYQWTYLSYPDDSVFQSFLGNNSSDHSLDTRFKFSWNESNFTFNADYSLLAASGERVRYANDISNALFQSAPINDRGRWFDLTRELDSGADTYLLHRLDRLSVGYRGDSTVIKFGRQAISWGNGLLFNPMDFLNPFDPAAIDKEYKTGDDMLYGQHLLQNGDDIQAVWVARRSLQTGKLESEVMTTAAKYHGFTDELEWDLLLANHYDDTIIAAGLSKDIAGAIYRGDIVMTQTDSKEVLSTVVNASYSWQWGGMNMSGVVEYFYNGFGQKDGNYSATALASNPELLSRLQRGELFNLGRSYLGASLLMELTPLWQLSPNVFYNLNDQSALVQVSSQNNLTQNTQLIVALNIPVGKKGTEFGGIDAEIVGQQLSYDYSVFLQLAYYF